MSAGVDLVVLSPVKEPRRRNALDLAIKGKAFLNRGALAGVSSPQKLAQTRLADLHVSHNRKLPEPHVCAGNRVCLLNCSRSAPRFKNLKTCFRALAARLQSASSSPALRRGALLVCCSASLPGSVHLQQQCQANPILQLVSSARGKLCRCLFNSCTCRI